MKRIITRGNWPAWAILLGFLMLLAGLIFITNGVIEIMAQHLGGTMAKLITKGNWPFGLFGLAFVAFLLFIVLLEVTPGPLAWALGLQLFIAVGGAAISSLVLIIRAVIATSRWAKAAEAGKQRTQRIIGVTLGYLFALPFAYLWFVMLALCGGFLSIAVGQRQMYH